MRAGGGEIDRPAEAGRRQIHVVGCPSIRLRHRRRNGAAQGRLGLGDGAGRQRQRGLCRPERLRRTRRARVLLRVEGVAALARPRFAGIGSVGGGRGRRGGGSRCLAGRGGGAPLPFLEAEFDILLELPKLFLELPILVLKRFDLSRELTGDVLQTVEAYHEFGGVLRLRGAKGGRRN
ncbi:hypothetical protein GCM10025880_27140 [Methylorubrum aminovorans]|nr:hypothetical protein GCM10025880_27140 [Methylorubrum aminovorans]